MLRKTGRSSSVQLGGQADLVKEEAFELRLKDEWEFSKGEAKGGRTGGLSKEKTGVKPRGRKMEGMAPEQQGVFPGTGKVWNPWGQKGRQNRNNLQEQNRPCSRPGTWRCQQLKLLSKNITSLDVCFRNKNLLALWVEQRKQILDVLARYSCQDLGISWMCMELREWKEFKNGSKMSHLGELRIVGTLAKSETQVYRQNS